MTDIYKILDEAEELDRTILNSKLTGDMIQKSSVLGIKFMSAAPHIKAELLRLRELEKIALEVLEASNNTTASIWKLRLREILEGK